MPPPAVASSADAAPPATNPIATTPPTTDPTAVDSPAEPNDAEQAASTSTATVLSTTSDPSPSDLESGGPQPTDDLTIAEPCTLNDVGVDQILVFGNSTDYTFGPDDGIDMVAWPELLQGRDRSELLVGVTIRNEAQRGQTMGDWDAWGPDPRLRLNTYSVSVLDSIAVSLRRTTLALVAPSFIDLQESDADIDRAISDLSAILTTLDSFGVRNLVLPMNYVSTTLNDRLPGLNPAIERFNRELSQLGLVVAPFIDSPLRAEGPAVGGADQWYDEFPGLTKDGDFRGADGFHLDDDGQLLKADAVIEVLTTYVAASNSDDACR